MIVVPLKQYIELIEDDDFYILINNTIFIPATKETIHEDHYIITGIYKVEEDMTIRTIDLVSANKMVIIARQNRVCYPSKNYTVEFKFDLRVDYTDNDMENI